MGKDRELNNKIDYFVGCISEFAKKFSLNMYQSYSYLYRFQGIDFLLRNYEAEHTLSIDDAVDDLTNICHRYGGALI